MALNENDVCKSKNTYLTENTAQEVIKLMNKETSQDAYLCPICKKYHITTIETRQKKKRKLKYLKFIVVKVKRFNKNL